MTTLAELIDFIETIAPLSLQESYDNAGLITGDRSQIIAGVLLTLDCTESIIDEAKANNCNVIIAHHPIIFFGIKKLTGRNYVERTIIKAIKNDIAIYACHTNLDNIYTGVNAILADKLLLQSPRILRPKKQLLSKLITYIPPAYHQQVVDSLFAAGAGNIGNYSNCSFNTEGMGSYCPSADAHPFKGASDSISHEKEIKTELIFPNYLEQAIIKALKESHPYEEISYQIITMQNEWQEVGAGMIGNWSSPKSGIEALEFIKNKLAVKIIKHTQIIDNQIDRVAVCGGSGSFLLNDAINNGAQIFITSDFKYHEFFNSDGNIMICDIGHYESEHFTKELLYNVISKKFITFAVRISNINTNPIHYY